MTLNRMHHPKADLSRMYIPRKEKGQGITKLEMIYKIATTGLIVTCNLHVTRCFTARKDKETSLSGKRKQGVQVSA